MSHVSGSALYVSWLGVAITGNQRSFDWNGQMDVADTTAGADAAQSHIPTTKSGDASMEVLYDNASAGSAQERTFYEGAQGTLIWGTEGTASGNPKYSRLATLTGVSQPNPYDDVVMYSLSWTFNGDWITNFNSLGSEW